MDALLETLRTCTDNTTRRAATAALRQAQLADPAAFLDFAWAGVSSPALAPEMRFFLAAAISDFVDHAWQSGVPRAQQEAAMARHAALLAGGPLPSAALARKVSESLSAMCRRGGGFRVSGGALPPAVEAAVGTLATGALRASAAGEPSGAAQCLLALHVFLKEAQTRRVGTFFPRLCAMLVPVMSELFAVCPRRAAEGWYTPLLYLYKCALRVFGFGVFEASFYPFLLHTTWELARETIEQQQQQQEEEQQQQQRLRLMEYALKVLEKAVVTFPSRLHELSLSFFSVTPDTAIAEPDVSLFALLNEIIFGQFAPLATEKLACRAMRLYVHIFNNEECDAFASTCVAALISRTDALRLLTRRLVALLADHTDTATLSMWDTDAERIAAELDLTDDDDDNAPCAASCAEQLLLALTGSSCGAPAALAAAWDAVHAALGCGSSDSSAMTAGLHAIGVCCYTMSSSPGYVDFLEAHLLPLMTAPPNAVSPFVLRRVVWLVGMWCEALQSPEERMRVHDALAGLLNRRETHIVLRLVALRTMGQFIADDRFTQAELSAGHVAVVLRALGEVVPALRTPTAVKEVAALAHAMAERGLFAAVGVAVGDALMGVFLPAAQRLIARAQPKLSAPHDVNITAAELKEQHAEKEQKEEKAKEEEEDEDDDDECGEVDAGALGTVLQCLGSCARDTSPDRAWALFSTVVVPCSAAGAPLAPWAEDDAWDLLLSLCRAARQWHSACDAALAWALSATARDFGSLAVAVRAAGTLLLLLLLLRPAGAAGDISNGATWDSVALRALEGMALACEAELREAYFLLLAILIRRGDAEARGRMAVRAVERLLALPDVQSDAAGVPLALLVVFALLPFPEDTHTATDSAAAAVVAAALTGAVRGHSCGESLAERLALLVDVSPSTLATRWLIALLQMLAERTPLLSEADMRLLGHLTEAEYGEEGAAQEDGEGTARDSARDMREALLEMFGDAQAPPGSPHVERLITLFGLNAA